MEGLALGAEVYPAEKKVVTVLFADIVGSTALIEELDPERALEFLTPIVEAMSEGVHRYGGVVNQVEGDGIMALFGAPVADEHHAIGACFAAIDIPRLVKSVDADVTVRVGVHSGQVLMHTEGNDMSDDYVASGPTVHLAAQMEHAARPGIPLVTAATASMAGGNVRLGASQEIEVLGFDAAIEVYELMGKADAVGSLQSRMNRRLTPFVARATELQQIEQLWERVDMGDGALLSIVGGPGVGKSRLLVEFVTRLPEGVEVLASQASPYDRSTPYRPIAEMMRSWLGRRGGGESNAGEVLEGLDASLTVYTDALIALIGGDPSVSWKAIDAGLRRQTTRRAIRAILGASAAERPKVLLFEDQHWMDGESLSIMDELADLAGATPLLMVITSRPESDDRWGELDHAETLNLAGLMGTDVEDFVETLIGTRSSTAAIRAELSDRTDGTPLFLEEMVRALADDGVLSGDHGKYKRGDGDFRIQMPVGVQAVIASRVDRLPPVAKELLQLIAVHGEDVRRDLLDVTTDRTERERTEAIGVLIESEMMFADNSTQPTSYSFKHNLIREVAYGGIPSKRREALHARIAEGVIALEFEEDWTERLAHHTFEAGQWEDAARFTLASAKRAEAKSAYRESEQFLSMSLEALALLPKNRANIEQTIDALITRRISTVGVGGPILGSLGELDDAESLAHEIGDLERVARVNLHRSYARSMIGHHQQGLVDADRAHGIGQQLGRRPLTAEANLAKAQHFAFAGQPAQVGPLIGRDLTFIRDEMGRNGMMGHRAVWAYSYLAIANGLMGNFDAAMEAAVDGTVLARERGRVLDQVHSRWTSALVQLYAENFEAAEENARNAADLAEAHEFARISTMIGIARGYALSRLGGLDEGIALLEESASVGESTGMPVAVAWAKVYLSEIMTACGQNENARTLAQKSLMLSRKHGFKAVEVMSLQMLGRAQHRLKESKGFFEEAFGLSVEHSLRPLGAQIKAELGWIVSEMGDRGHGRELVGQANVMRKEMGIPVLDLPDV